MITDRLLQASDYELLNESLKKDEFHKTTTPEFFTQEGTITKLYSLDGEPVLFCRACKSLRLDAQFLDNNNVQANRKTLEQGFKEVEQKAKENGFVEVLFNTSNPLFKRFATRKLGYTVVEGDELRKVL